MEDREIPGASEEGGEAEELRWRAGTHDEDLPFGHRKGQQVERMFDQSTSCRFPQTGVREGRLRERAEDAGVAQAKHEVLVTVLRDPAHAAETETSQVREDAGIPGRAGHLDPQGVREGIAHEAARDRARF